MSDAPRSEPLDARQVGGYGGTRLPGDDPTSAPDEPGPGPMSVPAREPQPWPEASPDGPPRGLAGTALAFALLGLGASFVVGWAIPVGIAAIVMAIVALRRPIESRAVAGWALALAILSVAYSAGWLVWAAVSSG